MECSSSWHACVACNAVAFSRPAALQAASATSARASAVLHAASAASARAV
eukprot:CAMPEP_0174753618 /NCGR_PEP_ID=MMETSP1094-20130205/104375_1 /TAXON_ID=156173 /ORGANISM="Chrysochromulina brevifilum, Strain UTEX LB 985" /LENGTH=49 /DNA_ID= /DNA_START= /DNA_END= /DNA_ORIENTATION=